MAGCLRPGRISVAAAGLAAARLHQREHARYGQLFRTDPSQAARTQAFLDWAAGYDDSSTGGNRTLANHTRWLAQFAGPVLELRGDLTVTERLAAVRAEIRQRHLFA
jgi:hypothetical protein